MTDVNKDPAVAHRFKVVIDNSHQLGVFSSCDGIGVEVVLEQREEGGNNEFIHQLPVRLKYPNVKLVRPVDEDSSKVSKWLKEMQGTITRSTAEITVLGTDGEPVTSWKLKGVIPVRWQGPSMGAENNKVATETLELAHHGFL
jgi:phage tail-like protein